MNNKVALSIKFDIEEFLTKKYNNCIFTEEAIQKAKDSIINTPIIIYNKDGNSVPIGVATDVTDGFIWAEINPEYSINDFEIIDGVTHIRDCNFTAMSMSFNIK